MTAAVRTARLELSSAATLRHALLVADVLTGVEELADFAIDGTHPIVLAGRPDPAPQQFRTIVETVLPADLGGGAGAIWEACLPVWRNGESLALEVAVDDVPDTDRIAASHALRFAREHGMGVAYQALPAARRLLAERAAFHRFDEALHAAADALTEIEMLLQGVP